MGTPVSEEMISEEAPELTLSQSPREWTPAPKTRPEKESAFDDVLSTTPDLDDPEDILTQNKARAGWWGHRHHPHRHNPHHHDPHEKKKQRRKSLRVSWMRRRKKKQRRRSSRPSRRSSRTRRTRIRPRRRRA